MIDNHKFVTLLAMALLASSMAPERAVQRHLTRERTCLMNNDCVYRTFWGILPCSLQKLIGVRPSRLAKTCKKNDDKEVNNKRKKS